MPPADFLFEFRMLIGCGVNNIVKITTPINQLVHEMQINCGKHGAAAVLALTLAGFDPDGLGVIQGDSVGQVAGFLVTGNLRQGFLSLAQRPDLGPKFNSVEVPLASGSLTQKAALLSDSDPARSFFTWLTGEAARTFIQGAGYHLPEVAK